jgi:tetratricopeptide (TPR) repeat protein
MTRRAAPSLALALALAFPCVLASSAALAAPPADSGPAEARQRFNEGIALADAGEHEAARLKFDQAWTLLKSPAVLFNLARAEQLSGHLVEALGHFRLFLKMASDPSVKDAQRQRATDNIAELTKKVGQLEIDAPESARVTVDGAPVALANGDPVAVSAGGHTIQAVLGTQTKTASVDCPAGTLTRAKLSFDSGGSVLVEAAVRTAPPPTTADAGPPDLETRNVVAGVLGAAALVGAGFGAGFLLASGAKSTSAKSYDESVAGGACAAPGAASCSELHAKQDAATGVRTLGWIGLGATATFAAGAAIVLLAWPSSSESHTGARLRPAVGLGSVGLRGEF